VRPSPKISKPLALFLLTLIAAPLTFAVPNAKGEGRNKDEGKKLIELLPSRLGEQAIASGKPQPTQLNEQTRANFLITDGVRRTYRLADGKALMLEVARVRTSAAAYALVTAAAEQMRGETNAVFNVLYGVGAYGFSIGKRVVFFRGTNFVTIEATAAENQESADYSYIAQAAKEFDSLLIKEGASDEDVPVLVMHLPAWEQVQQRAIYAVTLDGLQEAIGRQPILQGYDFSGGTEAVVAPYPSKSNAPARLVIIEHFTPQLAADNNRFVAARANELRASGAPVPAHRRIGNYLVFAFDAPTESAATELIGQVKYEQDVRWLGDNPFAQERANRAYTMMSINVLLSSLKSAGIGILLCLGIGSIVGGIIFMRRRAESLAASTYTDAGGMVRLGIDNLTEQEEPARLLSSGGKKST
jgi:hypothetical protein